MFKASAAVVFFFKRSQSSVLLFCGCAVTFHICDSPVAGSFTSGHVHLVRLDVRQLVSLIRPLTACGSTPGQGRTAYALARNCRGPDAAEELDCQRFQFNINLFKKKNTFKLLD